MGVWALLLAVVAAEPPRFLLVLSAHGPSQPGGGELSGNGLRMGYLFGKHLLGRYADFFPPRFDHKGAYVVASAADRCKQYAEAVMLGVYDLGSLSEPVGVAPEFSRPPWKGLEAAEDFSSPLPHGYQPVPVHSFNAEDNFVFEAHEPRVCPLLAPRLAGPAAELEALARAFLPQLQQHFKYESVRPYASHRDLHAYWEFLRAQKYLGAPAAPEELLQRLETLAGLSLLRSFADGDTLKFALTPLLRLLGGFLDEAEAALTGARAEHRRFVLAVGHDENIFLLQAALGQTSYACLLARARGESPPGECAGLPAPGSSLSVEVRADERGAPHAALLLNAKRQPFCSPHSEELCALKDFGAKLRSLALPGPQAALMARFCREPPADHNRYLLAMIGFNVALALLLAYFLFKPAKRA